MNDVCICLLSSNPKIVSRYIAKILWIILNTIMAVKCDTLIEKAFFVFICWLYYHNRYYFLNPTTHTHTHTHTQTNILKEWAIFRWRKKYGTPWQIVIEYSGSTESLEKIHNDGNVIQWLRLHYGIWSF